MYQRLASVALLWLRLGLGAFVLFLSSLQIVTLPTTGRVSPKSAEERPQDRHAGRGAQDWGSNAVCDIWEQRGPECNPSELRSPRT